MTIVRRFAEICKVEDQEDGTLKVYGYCSSGAEDSEGEIVLPEAMKAALPDYMKFGAVREMHQPLAAGTAIEAQVQEDGKTFFGAHVVDPVAVKKVKAGVYKGFSIGGKVLERDPANKKIITKLRLIENSLVDRPANPEALFTFYKLQEDKPAEPAAPAATAPAAEPAAAKRISIDDRDAIAQISVMLNKGEIGARDLLAVGIAQVAKAKAGPRKKLLVAETKKGMGMLAQFAQLLQSISWLAQDSAGEAAWEGDNSPVPAQLRDWIATGVMIFENMSTEETNELLESLKPDIEIVVEAAAQAEMAKAGAKFSAATKKALADCHASMQKCMDHAKAACDGMSGLGYDKKADDMESAEQPGDVLKAALQTSAQPAADDTVTKLQATVTSQATELEELKKRLKTLEDQPLPAKGPTRVVGKTEDNGTGDPTEPGVDPVLNADGSVNKAATEVKQVHAGGARLVSVWNRPQRTR